jgi:hypothetical protein
MTSLSDHQSNQYTKLIAIGDAMTAKTGSLVSLVKAGYKLRILDMDNKLGVLKSYVLKECPDLAGNVEFRTLRDQHKATSVGIVIDGQPRAYVDAAKMLMQWKYKAPDGTEIDFGDPSEWGPDCVLVVDSLSRLCDAAYDWREPLTPRGKSGEYDARAVYGDSQDAVEAFIADLTSDNFRTNVIVIAHIVYQDLPDGTTKGFPQGLGQKLSPRIPQYFPNMVRYYNKNGKRSITTAPTNIIDLANERPDALRADYSVETGLAEIFEVLRGKPK